MRVEGAERGAGGAGETDSEERRGKTGQRVQFEALVAVGEQAGGAGFEAESVDMSPDGMRLRTAYLPEVGEKLVCRFDGMSSEIVVDGEVLWCNEHGRGGEFGLRFVDLDERSTEAVRSMCATLSKPDMAAGDGAGTARGTRVRLHIEGLGSPMKARVRDASTAEILVGSNLEFLRVGRPLEIEDVEQGIKRDAYIDHVKVEIDPVSSVPQLVVALRYEGVAAGEREPTRQRVHTLPFGLRSPLAADASNEETSDGGRSASDERMEGESATEPSATQAEDDDEAVANRFLGAGAKASRAGMAMVNKVGPALSNAGARARDGALVLLEAIRRRRAEHAEAKKAKAPRRMTAPPPAGALKSEGRKLVRDDGTGLEEEPAPSRINKKAVMIGSGLGVLAVVAVFAMSRFGGMGHHAIAGAEAPSMNAAAQSPATDPAPAAPGTPTADVPLFGATPLSTTEPAPGAPMTTPPAADEAAMASADSDEEPGIDDVAGEGKQFASGGELKSPIVFKIKMDGTIEKIAGASGALGFTVRVPDRKSVNPNTDFGRKDKRLQSVHVVNKPSGAEITFKFKEGVPPFAAKAKGDRLEISVGRSDGSKKIAKAHEKGAKKASKKSKK